MDDDNLERLLETKPLSSYSEDAIKNIKLLTFSKKELAHPFGSYIYRLQKYPGDLDLVEEFTDCCNEDDVVRKFAKKLQQIVKKINSEKIHYFSEFKAGLDNRYDIDIGEMIDGIYKPRIDLSIISYNLFNKGLLSNEEYSIIQYILLFSDLGSNEYDTVTYIFRERRILRWKSDEILNGIKLLPGNKKITLENALKQHDSHVKIDMIALINDRLIEVTNFFQLAYVSKEGKVLNIINIDVEENHNIPVHLPFEIEKLYFSNMFYSPFKMVKRMYSLGRNKKYIDLLNSIIPFVSSNISLLYQIKSEIDTIILIIEKIKKYPSKTIEYQLDEMKFRISTVTELSKEELLEINDLIYKINKIDYKYDKLDDLKLLKKILVKKINYFTIEYLIRFNLNPPPPYLLPNEHTYYIYHARGPNEYPENPFVMYSNIIDKMNYGKGGIDVYYPVDHHFPNFFEDPNSSAILSQRIISNPGLNEVPKYLTYEPVIGGIGNKISGWWAAFNKHYKKDYDESPPISFDEFKYLFSKESKYNYKKFARIVNESEDIPQYNNQWESILNRCENRTDKFIDHLLQMKQPYKSVQEEELIGFEPYKPSQQVLEKPLIPSHKPSFQPPQPEEIQSIPPPPPSMIPKKPLTKKEIKEMEQTKKTQESGAKMMEELAQRISKPQLKHIEPPPEKSIGKVLQAEGRIGGYVYAHNFRIPLYMNENLPLPKLLQNEMHLHPQTASSYSSDYANRGYGPSLKPVHINNAPLVINGEIIPGIQRAGCESCGLSNFRKIH